MAATLALSLASAPLTPSHILVVGTESSPQLPLSQRVIQSHGSSPPAFDMRLGQTRQGKTHAGRRDLVLIFPGVDPDSRKGLLAVRVWVESARDRGPGLLRLDAATLIRDENGYALELDGSSKDQVLCEPMWTRSPNLSSTYWVTSGSEPKTIRYRFLNAAPVGASLPCEKSVPQPGRLRLKANFGDDLLVRARAVDSCLQGLENLSENLASPDDPWVWEESKLCIDAVAEASHPQDFEPPLFIRISPTEGNIFGCGPPDFPAQVRMIVAMRNDAGRLQNAEVILRAEL